MSKQRLTSTANDFKIVNIASDLLKLHTLNNNGLNLTIVKNITFITTRLKVAQY